MAEHGEHLSLAVATAPGSALEGQFRQECHQGGRPGLQQGEAGGDVHLFHTVGDAVQHGGEQPLVAQHHGAAVAGRHPFLAGEPLAHVAALHAAGGGADEGDVLRLGEMVVDG